MSQISLVGAGPGPSNCWTLRALHRIPRRQQRWWSMTAWWGARSWPGSPGAARFDVGGRCGEPSPTQEEINALLLALARTGKRVVRPQGGSGCSAGRGGGAAPGPPRHRGRAGARYHGGPGLRRQHSYS